jgi:hypothetical protein
MKLFLLLGVASIGSALSQNIDALIDFRIKKALKNMMTMHIGFLNSYPDFFAMIIVLITSCN